MVIKIPRSVNISCSPCSKVETIADNIRDERTLPFNLFVTNPHKKGPKIYAIGSADIILPTSLEFISLSKIKKFLKVNPKIALYDG